MRTRDPLFVERVSQASGFGTMDPEPWLADDRNVAIEEGENVTLFQWEGGDTYSVHWLLTARGRDAVTIAKDMLSAIFDLYGARAVWGIIPVENRKSRLFTRRLGCRSLGIIRRPDGSGELFMIGKRTWASSAT